MNHTKTQKLLPIKILEASYWYLLPGTAVQAQKNKNVLSFLMGQKHARGVRFLLRFNMYLFLAHSKKKFARPCLQAKPIRNRHADGFILR